MVADHPASGMRRPPVPILPAKLAAALLGWLLVVAPVSAAARVVGIVFDDSGSMQPHVHLPAFGVQLLVSTLDARSRLFVTRFGQVFSAFDNPRILPAPPEGVTAGNALAWAQRARRPPWTEVPLGQPAQLQAAIEEIAAQWTNPRVDTPYEPIEMMLALLVREVPPGDQAVLVVVSDGAFDPAPDLARLRRSYAEHRAALVTKGASLRVEFLLIAPQRDTLDIVTRQGVRAALLETFNGAADGSAGGLHDVTNLTQLSEAMREIIARVWSAELRPPSPVGTVAGNALVLESPLSIRRLVAFGTAVAPERPPRLLADPPGSVDPRRLATAMRRADTAAGLAGLRAEGATVQLRLDPPLPAGRHQLGFDRPPEGVTLFVEAAARVVAVLVHPDGRAVPRDGNVYQLPIGAPFRIEARLHDDGAGGQPVRLNQLGRVVEATAIQETPGGARRVPMTIEAASGAAVAALEAATPGPSVLRAELQVAGFIAQASAPLALEVFDGRFALAAELRPLLPCAECVAGELAVTLGRRGPPVAVGEITLHSEAPRAGTLMQDRAALPAGLLLLTEDGTPLPADRDLPLAAGAAARRLLLAIDPAAPLAPSFRFGLGFSAREPLTGRAEIGGTLRVRVPEARLELVAQSGGDAGEPVPLDGDGLTEGSGWARFALRNNLVPLRLEELTVEGGGPLIALAPRLAAATADGSEMVEIAPASGFLCLCPLALLPAERSATVHWRHPGGLQQATAALALRLELSWAVVLRSCIAILLLLLALLWLVMAILTALRTRRFPRNSLAEVREGRQMPRFVDLRGGSLPLLRALLPWRSFRLDAPHERRVVEGLTIEATGNGGAILLRTETSPFRVVRLGQTSEELQAAQPRRDRVAVIWNDEIEPLHMPRTVVKLWRRPPGH